MEGAGGGTRGCCPVAFSLRAGKPFLARHPRRAPSIIPRGKKVWGERTVRVHGHPNATKPYPCTAACAFLVRPSVSSLFSAYSRSACSTCLLNAVALNPKEKPLPRNNAGAVACRSLHTRPICCSNCTFFRAPLSFSMFSHLHVFRSGYLAQHRMQQCVHLGYTILSLVVT